MKHRLDVVRGFSSLCLYCVVVVIHFFWLVNACFCCIRFHFFPYQAKSQEIGLGERLQNDLFLCWVGHKTLLTHSETLAFSCILIRILLHICQVNLASRMQLLQNFCVSNAVHRRDVILHLLIHSWETPCHIADASTQKNRKWKIRAQDKYEQVHHRRTCMVAYSINFTIGHPFPLKIATSHREIWTPIRHGSLAHLNLQPKGHLDRFSRFCRAHDRDRQTDWPTDRPRYSVCNSRPHRSM